MVLLTACLVCYDWKSDGSGTLLSRWRAFAASTGNIRAAKSSHAEHDGSARNNSSDNDVDTHIIFDWKSGKSENSGTVGRLGRLRWDQSWDVL
jgi:hypothetical protein